MHEENVVDIYTRTLLSLKNEVILTLMSTWMNLKDIMLSEISQAQEDKYDRISPIGGI